MLAMDLFQKLSGRIAKIILCAFLAWGFVVACAPTTQAQQGHAKPVYFGHYFVESPTHGSHLHKVIDHANVHYVAGIAGLQACARRGVQAIVDTRWHFFAGGSDIGEWGSNPLRDDYEERWNNFADQVEPYIDHVEAFYVMDEPYWRGASVEDLERCCQVIKDRFPDIPVMVVFAVPPFEEDWFVVPESADWVGFDLYRPIEEVAANMEFLLGKMHPHQDMWLVPESFLKSVDTDAELAELNWAYYKLALTEPRVIGLLAFGLFTHVEDPTSLPLTIQAQREIAERIAASQQETQ